MGTKHCCWGECKTDSRYPEKWPESLKELKNSGQKVFIPFPKPWRDLAKCKRWIVACSREFFTEKNVNKNTYICALHWPGGKGHTVEFSDPLKANLTPTQAGRASAPKRKAPKSREEPVTKQKKVINENCGEQSDEFLEFVPTDDRELLESSTTDAINDRESTRFDEVQVMCDVTRKHVYENLSGKLVSDQESQTVYSKYELSAKVETMILNSATVHRYHNNNIVRKLCSHRRPNMNSHKIAFAVLNGNTVSMISCTKPESTYFLPFFNGLSVMCPSPSSISSAPLISCTDSNA